MIFCINKNNLAFCLKEKRNGSIVPPSTKELHVEAKKTLSHQTAKVVLIILEFSFVANNRAIQVPLFAIRSS